MPDSFLEIWHGDILSVNIERQDYYAFLSDEEKLKATTFLRPELQKKYIKTRGALRKVLASYLNINPQSICIKTGKYGKPFIENEIFFNLTHAGNKFAIAVSNCSEVGIDLECHKNRINLQGLVGKCFSKQEKAYWQALAKEQQEIMFYRFWVRKEALVKAVGRGIALGLNQCVVDPLNQLCFIDIPSDSGEAGEWKIVEVTLNKDYVCAVVINDVEFNYRLKELK